MKYVKMYADQAAYDADNEKEYPHVGYVEGSDTVIYMNEPDWSKEYLTFEALESGTFKLSGKTCQYSLDGGATWTSLASNTDTPTVNAGEKIMFKEILTGSNGAGSFSSTGNFNVMGNAYSMISGDNFSNITTLTMVYALKALFSGCTKLISAEKLSLPATTLNRECYGSMFYGCRSLTTPPKLPATTLANSCYYGMFSGCTSLTTAPELPATTLSESGYARMFQACTSLTKAPALPATTLEYSCYQHMFYGCRSLTTAPELPATTLVNSCYKSMFHNCTNLNYIKMLATDISANQCLTNWTYGVAASGTLIKDASMNSLPEGSNGIPTGWTVINATP